MKRTLRLLMMGLAHRAMKLCRNHTRAAFGAFLLLSVALFAFTYYTGSHTSLSSSSVLEQGLGDRKLNALARDGSPDHARRHRGGRRGKKPGIIFDDGDDFEDPNLPVQVCKMPKLSLNSDANRDAFQKMPPLECNGENLFFVRRGDLYLNKTVLRGGTLKRCEYQAIQWASDDYFSYSKLYVQDQAPFEMKVRHDFFHVRCYLDKKDQPNDGRRSLQALQDDEKTDDSEADVNNELNQEDSEGALEQRGSDSDGINNVIPANPDTDPIANQYKLNNAMNEEQEEKGSRHYSDNKQVMRNTRTTEHDQVNVDTHKQIDNKLHNGVNSANDNLSKNDPSLRRPDNNEVDKDEMERKPAIERAIRNDFETSQDKPLEGRQVLNVDTDYNNGDPAESQEGFPDYRDPNFGLEEIPDFEQFVAQIYPKTEELVERLSEYHAKEGSLQMNVLIFAMDSMSHLAYQRMLPKTYSFLKDQLGAVTLDGYNIVGDATTANIIPFLTGQTELELPETRKNKDQTTYVDIYPFIWNKYEQSGYVTLYAEDQPSLGTFQLRLNGFEEPPVDHYMRPFWQSALASELHKDSPRYCLGAWPEHKYTLSYLRQFFQRYKTIPKFAFGFLGELSHDNNSPSSYIDEDFVLFLNSLRQSQLLENTLLIVMGDHGARYSKVRGTVQGKLEERLPMMSLTFPQTFKDAYPQLVANLNKNAWKLTTPFDIHETLKDLLDIRRTKVPPKYNSRGISILQEIPLNRTCEAAGIDMHWCTCMKYGEANVKDKSVQLAAKEMMSQIKLYIKDYRNLCEDLSLKEILDARVVIPNEKVLRFQKSIDPDQRIANFTKDIQMDIIHYQVILETRPNDGMYEATVQHDVARNVYSISHDISRINRYGDQPHCIIRKAPDLRKFCYCKTQKSK